MTNDPAPPVVDVVILTGLAGAGRGTAIRALEDLGWEAVDNLPLAMIPRLADPAQGGARLAIGCDSRTRGFSAEALIAMIAELRATPDIAPSLVFVDASDETLISRFAATRRRHPLSPEENAAIGVSRERALLAELRARADMVLDTSGMSPHDLKAAMAARVDRGAGRGMAISIQSFSFRRGAPREADLVFDCRFLRNPHWEPSLRPLDGRDPRVAEHIAEDPLHAPFFDRVLDLARLLLPAYKREGKAYLCVGFGCSGGRHRSVAIAERLAAALTADGERTTLRHRELEGRKEYKGAP